MSKEAEELKRTIIRRIDEAKAGTFDAIVESVNEASRTCLVRVSNIVYEDVALYAVENESLKGFCMIPKKNSRVLVSRIGGSNMLYVAMFSELDKILITIGEEQSLELTAGLFEILTDSSNLRITSQGFTIIRDGSGLKKTLKELCSEIRKIRVPTNSGPSGSPINKLKFTAIENDLNNYLEG